MAGATSPLIWMRHASGFFFSTFGTTIVSTPLSIFAVISSRSVSSGRCVASERRKTPLREEDDARSTKRRESDGKPYRGERELWEREVSEGNGGLGEGQTSPSPETSSSRAGPARKALETLVRKEYGDPLWSFTGANVTVCNFHFHSYQQVKRVSSQQLQHGVGRDERRQGHDGPVPEQSQPLASAMRLRAGAGQPVGVMEAPNSPLPENAELIWDDGSPFPEPCLDNVAPMVGKYEALAWTMGGLGLFAGIAGLAAWNDKASRIPFAPREYPYDGLRVELGKEAL